MPEMPYEEPLCAEEARRLTPGAPALAGYAAWCASKHGEITWEQFLKMTAFAGGHVQP
jgi:hypothetical protein